jgi:hypothetical protein
MPKKPGRKKTRKRGAGRPQFVPTPEQRRIVEINAAAGMSHDEMSQALGIGRATFAKAFHHELDVGAYQRRMRVNTAMYRAACKGNVAAAKHFGMISPKAREGEPAPNAPPLIIDGKKARAREDAKSAEVGTDWETLLKPPGRVQ